MIQKDGKKMKHSIIKKFLKEIMKVIPKFKIELEKLIKRFEEKIND